MERSPIQLKKQDIENSSGGWGWGGGGGEGWKQRKEVLDKTLKRWDRQYRVGSLQNIGGARNPMPTLTHKELFWKKDALVV